jgi:hypothetical protein
MRRKLLVLSALTCIAGGSALLAPTPAASQSQDDSCEELRGQVCSGYQFIPCTRENGQQDWLQCVGWWVWA